MSSFILYFKKHVLNSKLGRQHTRAALVAAIPGVGGP